MSVKYILDTNVYIEAYKGYYHPDIVPVYWDILKDLGEKNIVKSPIQVRDEIKSRINLQHLKSHRKMKTGFCMIGLDLVKIIAF